MKLDVSNLYKKSCDLLEFERSENVESINYSEDKLVLTSPVSIKGNICKQERDLFLEASVNFSYKDQCARCLKEIETNIEYELDVRIVKGTYNEDEVEDYNVFVLDSEKLDLIKVIESTLDFNISHKNLCDENCRGICPGCGVDLNRAECKCDQSEEDDDIDPRLAKLKELLK